MRGSREVLALLLYGVLDPQQEGGLPLVQLTHAVVLEELVGEDFLIALLDGIGEVNKELMLACGWEGGIELAVALQSTIGTNHILVFGSKSLVCFAA